MRKGLFTPNEGGSEIEKDQRISDKHQREFSLSLGVNGTWALIGKDILDVRHLLFLK